MWIKDIIESLESLCDGAFEWHHLIDHIDHNLIYFTNKDIYSITAKEWVMKDGKFTENYR